MPHFLVVQQRFARSEFVRCLEGVAGDEARRRLEPMNCISWIVGHLANQEHEYWVRAAQGRDLFPNLNALVGHGSLPSTPPLDEMWDAWHAVTAAADEYLETLTPNIMETYLERGGQRMPESVGTLLLRNLYHYWFHTGEGHAIRQQLGHTDLPQFVGNMSQALFRQE